MDAIICNDENASERANSKKNSKSKMTPVKAPLKPVNDSRRLTVSPQVKCNKCRICDVSMCIMYVL